MESTRPQGYGLEQPEPLLLLVADVQRVLGVSRSTLYRLIREGSLTPLYLDDRPRFDEADVRALITNAKKRAAEAARDS